MKRVAVLSLLLFCLSGCARQGMPVSVQQCPEVGINVMHPDFHRQHNMHVVDNFFLCLESQARTAAYNVNVRRNVFERMFISPEVANQRANDQVAMLEYQRTLWRQVLTGDKEPDIAYQAWMQYMQNERMIAAANASAEAADRAAAAANNASMMWWHY